MRKEYCEPREKKKGMALHNGIYSTQYIGAVFASKWRTTHTTHYDRCMTHRRSAIHYSLTNLVPSVVTNIADISLKSPGYIHAKYGILKLSQCCTNSHMQGCRKSDVI